MTTNGRLPWFPFYVERFLGSRRVRRMSAEQVGIYVLLLTEEWDKGPLPDDDDDLAFIGRSGVENVRRILGWCFQKTDAGWVNDVLEDIRSKQAAKQRQAKAAAQQRWEKHADA